MNQEMNYKVQKMKKTAGNLEMTNQGKEKTWTVVVVMMKLKLEEKLIWKLSLNIEFVKALNSFL